MNKYWSETLKNEAYEKSTLSYLNIDSMKIGETHPVWNSLDSVVSDVRKGTIKCRMLTGTYILQSTSYIYLVELLLVLQANAVDFMMKT